MQIPFCYVWLVEKSCHIYFFSKSHIWKMWLQFFNDLYSIFWEFRNQSSALYINVCMQKIPDGLFWIIFNSITPLLFYDNIEVLHKFLCTVKYHIQWFYKYEKIDPAPEQILIHFKPDDFWFVRCHQQLCR